MGYRSDVTIRCEEKAINLFKEAWQKVDFKPHRMYVSGEKGNCTYTLCWDSVKWYAGYEEVEAIMDVCNQLNEYVESGYAYKFIEVGEDNATEEYGNETGYDVFSDFYIVVDVNLPKDNRDLLED